jgi:hypothetical protein
MNPSFGVSNYDRQGHSNERVARRARRASKKSRRLAALKWVAVLAVTAVALALGLIQTAAANPDHSAGDYFMYALAGANGISDRKANEQDCDGSNDKQSDISGSDSFFYGRIHSHADIAISGSGNDFVNTGSPNPEITFGVNDGPPPACQVQADNQGGNGGYFSGGPTNITGNGDPADVNGPYQIGLHGWPGNLGTFLNADGETFPHENHSVTNLPDRRAAEMDCDVGTLTGTGTVTVVETAAFEGMVVCSGTGPILLSGQGFGSAANPFEITMISHGAIDVSGSDHVLAPAEHGVLAWTDAVFAGNPAPAVPLAVKLQGSNINVPQRSILFTPRSGQSISGSVNATVCVQMIGQGSLLANGSSTHFGPLAPGCGVPALVTTDIHAAIGGNAHHSLGQSGVVEVGTQVHDQVTVSSNTIQPQPLLGSMDFRRYSTGNCQGTPVAEQLNVDVPGTPTSHVFEDVMPFTSNVGGVFSYQAEYNGDPKNLAATSPCEGPIRFVDARITITPGADANEAGTPHLLTGHVDVNDGTGFASAPAGTVISFAMVSGTGTLSAPSCMTIGTTGSCTVTLNNASAGSDVVSASTTVSVHGVSLTRSTNGNAGPGGSGNASKTWVKVRIAISPPTDANEVGTNHVLTITLEKSVAEDVWTPLAGETVSAAITNSNGATAAFVPPAANTCVTDAGGTCTVTINSPTAGTTSVEATWAGGTVEGATISAKATNPDATKTWVKVRISITPPTDANEAGSNHDLTITLEQSVVEGTWTPLAGEEVTAAITNTNGATAVFVPAGGNTCTTGAGGTCIVTINSPTAGTTSVEASWAGGTVAGAAVTGKSSDPDASKTWVKVRISITPPTAANEVGTDHVLTITLEKSVAEGVWAPLTGESVSAAITNSNGATAAFVPVGANSCLTGAGGACTVTINSPTTGTSSVEATWAGGTVEGATVSAKATNPDASKSWVAVRISISPPNDANEVGANHLLTITLEKSVAAGAWAAFAGETVTAHVTNTNGASAVFVPAGDDECTTLADGTCTVTISSPTAGSTSVEARWAGGTVDGATVAAKASDPDASKAWVAVRISITPPTDANEVGMNHVLTITLERSVADGVWTPLNGETVTAAITNSNGATAAFVPPAASSCLTAGAGQCTVTINSPTAGTTSVEATWAGGTVEGAAVSAQASDPDASKTWVKVRVSIGPANATNPLGTDHELTITLEKSIAEGVWAPLVGELVTASLTNSNGATASFVPAGDNTCTTGATGACTVTINSPTAGTTVVEATWAGGTVEGATITAKVTEPDATKLWVGGGGTLLIIDEDSIDNGIHFNPFGGLITPGGPDFFEKPEVNDDRPGTKQRAILRYFADHAGDTITVKTGQTGDEGWFAPTCIPQKWISGTSNTCLMAPDRQTGIDNYFGLSGSTAIPSQSRLDKIPAVMPLRALGLNALVGRDICAVVYDSDISINYDKTTFPFTSGNLQGETLGIVAFTVTQTRTLNGFSSSTLPQVTLTINDASSCNPNELFNAPVPKSSSVPNDRIAPGSQTGYKALMAVAGQPLFF